MSGVQQKPGLEEGIGSDLDTVPMLCVLTPFGSSSVVGGGAGKGVRAERVRFHSSWFGVYSKGLGSRARS